MLIKEIKIYLSNKKQANLDEISFHLGWDKEVIRHALFLLTQKGLVEEVSLKNVCKGCHIGCNYNGKVNKFYRLNTVVNADEIITMGNGSVIKDRTHESLMNSSGLH